VSGRGADSLERKVFLLPFVHKKKTLPQNLPGKWQAANCPPPISCNAGVSLAQRASAIGQRVRKRQPLGGLIGLGGSPSIGTWRRVRSMRGSGTGAAAISVR